MTSRSDFPCAQRDALSPPWERIYARSLETFAEAARRKPSVGPDLTDGLESPAVVLAAGQAARMGQKVAVTTAVEES